MTNLESLSLGYNQLSGSIPAELGSLTNLSLGSNQLSIPTELGSLTNLESLSLGSNQLSGSIPAELGSLTNLTSLWLYGNQLSGGIPTELGSLTNLTSLSLSGNQLSGGIPTELGSLTNLTYLYLHENSLTGCIPRELGGATKLQYLLLHNNSLIGVIPYKGVTVNKGETCYTAYGGNSSDPDGTSVTIGDALERLTALNTNGGFRAYGNELEAKVTLTLTPDQTLYEGGGSNSFTATVTVDDAGLAWAESFKKLDPNRDTTNCPGLTPAPGTCYVDAARWTGKVTATKSGETGAVGVTVTPADRALSISKGQTTPSPNAFTFTLAPAATNMTTDKDETVTFSVSGLGAPGVMDAKAKISAKTVTVRDTPYSPPPSPPPPSTPPPPPPSTPPPPPPPPPPPTPRFSDVADSSMHFDSIAALWARGGTMGCSVEPFLYCPDSFVTRAQMAAFLLRGLVWPSDQPSKFTDVDPASTHATAIGKLYAEGVVSGCTSEPLRFCPDSFVTRAQMATFLVRAFNLVTPKEAIAFADVDPTSTHHASIQALFAAGVTSGCATEPLRFCPDSFVTRAQMATFLVRALAKV